MTSHFRERPPQMYHHYEGNECVARFIMHEDGGGVWFTGPITLKGYEKRTIKEDGRIVETEIPVWDETKKDEIFLSRQRTEALAVNAMRRKLGTPPVGVGLGETWADLDKPERIKAARAAGDL